MIFVYSVTFFLLDMDYIVRTKSSIRTLSSVSRRRFPKLLCLTPQATSQYMVTLGVGAAMKRGRGRKKRGQKVDQTALTLFPLAGQRWVCGCNHLKYAHQHTLHYMCLGESNSNSDLKDSVCFP